MNEKELQALPGGEGGFGRCYILDNDTLYKKFFKQSDGKYPFTKKTFDKTAGLQIDGFVFPKELDLQDGYVRGYTMDYIHAPNLEDIDYSFSINDFILALDKLKAGLYEVTSRGILICDINAKNMLYDGDSFHVIDTDLYIPSDETNYDPEEFNENYLSTYLYSFIVEEMCPYNIGNIIKANDYLNYINESMVKHANINNIKEFLYELRDSLSSLVHRDVNSFNDMYLNLYNIK